MEVNVFSAAAIFSWFLCMAIINARYAKPMPCAPELDEGCDGDNCNNAFLSNYLTNNIPEKNTTDFSEQ
jgi:hypothetical protein